MTTEVKRELKKIKSNPLKRLAHPSPKFFQNVQKWCIFLAFAFGALSSYLLTLSPMSRLGIALGSFAGFIGVFGTILAKLPIDEDKVVEKLEGEDEE